MEKLLLKDVLHSTKYPAGAVISLKYYFFNYDGEIYKIKLISQRESFHSKTKDIFIGYEELEKDISLDIQEMKYQNKSFIVNTTQRGFFYKIIKENKKK